MNKFLNKVSDLKPGPGQNPEFITLARVVKTQGRKGEVAAEVHTHVPERFAAGMKLAALPRGVDNAPDALRRELEVEALWPHKGLLVLKFVGVDSISQAETLIGCELQVPRRQRATLDPGWHYVSDLIGSTVFDHGREVGRIEDVQFGAGEAPLLVVKSKQGKEFDIPFAEAYAESVDINAQAVKMNLPQGMLEVNAPVTAEEKEQQATPGKKRH